MGRITSRRRIVRRTVGAPPGRREDVLTVEEPLEIRVGGRSLAITMRTPGNDVDLALGFLVSEAVITRGDDVVAARYCAGTDDDGANTYNVLDITLAPGVAAPDPGLERNFFISSSCGLCGKASIDAVRTRSVYPVADDPVRVTEELHAAGLFDVATGRALVVREDVGRHNAVDKVIGWAAREGLLPLRGTVLMVSGRASFELTQKASMAGIPVLAAVSAPSSLAVELGVDVGLTVVGFLRGQSMTVYSGGARVMSEAELAALAS
jgi:FdhD protein